MIMTRHWVGSISDKGNASSLDQKFEHKIWIKSLVIKSGPEI